MINTDNVSAQRLFAAIVLMGTGLAAGCGGIASGERQEGPTSGGSGAAGAATSTAGSAAYVGGATTTGVGGDIILPASGGASPVPTLGCPTEQWNCATASCSPAREGWQLLDGCKCDSTRPARASDCPADQVFACRDATSGPDGRPLSTPVALSCTCVDKGAGSCSDQCDRAYAGRDLACDGGVDARSVLCGCAVVLLK